MQMAIDWSEEEEEAHGSRCQRARRVVKATAADEDPSSVLSLESLKEEIKKIASRQEELYQEFLARDRRPVRASKREPLKDSEGRYICYACSEAGHTS